MGIYKQMPALFESFQVTVENLEELEAWCQGSIKGTKLPRVDREIEIYSNDSELRAAVGDYIVVNLATRIFSVYSDENFQKSFCIA